MTAAGAAALAWRARRPLAHARRRPSSCSPGWRRRAARAARRRRARPRAAVARRCAGRRGRRHPRRLPADLPGRRRPLPRLVGAAGRDPSQGERLLPPARAERASATPSPAAGTAAARPGPRSSGSSASRPTTPPSRACPGSPTAGASGTWARYRDAARGLARPASYPQMAGSLDGCRDTAPHGCVYDDVDALAAAAAYLHDLGAGPELDARAWQRRPRLQRRRRLRRPRARLGARVRDRRRRERLHARSSRRRRSQRRRTDVPGARAQLRADGLAAAPADAPEAVRRAIAAANAISDRPYRLVHYPTHLDNPTYDCSSSTSHVLWGAGAFGTAAAGLRAADALRPARPRTLDHGLRQHRPRLRGRRRPALRHLPLRHARARPTPARAARAGASARGPAPTSSSATRPAYDPPHPHRDRGRARPRLGRLQRPLRRPRRRAPPRRGRRQGELPGQIPAREREALARPRTRPAANRTRARSAVTPSWSPTGRPRRSRAATAQPRDAAVGQARRDAEQTAASASQRPAAHRRRNRQPRRRSSRSSPTPTAGRS